MFDHLHNSSIEANISRSGLIPVNMYYWSLRKNQLWSQRLRSENNQRQGRFPLCILNINKFQYPVITGYWIYVYLQPKQWAVFCFCFFSNNSILFGPSVHIFSLIAKPVDALPSKSIGKDGFDFFLFQTCRHNVTYFCGAVITRPNYYLWCLSIAIVLRCVLKSMRRGGWKGICTSGMEPRRQYGIHSKCKWEGFRSVVVR